MKPHYYGGIRKYQWSAVPLAMHGVVVKADGEAVTVSIGEEPGDPQFCITDLLPHLSAEQNGRKLGEGIKGEELNIVVGSIPFIGEEDEKIKAPVKLMAMKLLHEKYGITEKDFTRAEIEMVPAYKAVDIVGPQLGGRVRAGRQGLRLYGADGGDGDEGSGPYDLYGAGG